MSAISGKRIAKNTFFLYCKIGINTIVLLYTTRIVLNALGAVDYGIYGVVGGAIAMLGYLNSAMATTTQRFMSYAEGEGKSEKKSCYFNTSVIIHMLLGISILIIMEILFYPMFNGILNIPEERKFAAECIYQMMAISTVVTILTVPYEATINAHEDLVYYSIVGVGEALLKLSAALIIVHAFVDKLILYGILMASISIIMMMIMRFYCHKHYKECKFSPKKYFSKSVLKEMGSFAGWSFVGVFSSIMGNYGTGLILNHFFGTIVIAAQTICNQIGGQLLVFSSNMLKAMNPAIVKSAGEGNKENMLKLNMTGCRFSFCLYALFAIPFFIETDYILKIWLKNVPEWAVLFCQLQVLRTLLEQLTFPMGMSLIAVGNIRQINITDLILGISTFAVLFIVYECGVQPYWHFIVSIFLLVIVESGFKLYFNKKFCKLNILSFVKNVYVRCLICFVIAYSMGYAFVSIDPSEGFIRLIYTTAISMLTLIISTYYICLTKSEKGYFVEAINNRLNKNK
jgi:Na+-driven multidrug efflux pump